MPLFTRTIADAHHDTPPSKDDIDHALTRVVATLRRTPAHHVEARRAALRYADRLLDLRAQHGR